MKIISSFYCFLTFLKIDIQAELVVVMEKCWGNPVADRDNTMRYYMIQVDIY